MADQVGFRIPESILAGVMLSNELSISDGSFLARLFLRLPAELWYTLLSFTDYRTLVLLALSCKRMAVVVINTQAFRFAAATEEAEHAKLGHYEYLVQKAYLNLRIVRSKLHCSHHLCPFYMKPIWAWSKNVRRTAERLMEEQKKKNLEAKMLEDGQDDKALQHEGEKCEMSRVRIRTQTDNQIHNQLQRLFQLGLFKR
ncbi:hypothetical protein G647_00653 [Cladophialophora carrionii CBS 160.54]|uniref:F-box domain-containing protein n=1 Tax=Cladophialophora carrionii CBS 160.54 TaxID=1279043 RepID=V9DMR3_9EURO|nr:uncharacterized protein G647_00653 [Cladophialophora carrionii CBS 160.54]ETI28204.1 hypothetical protein G647_00653 [Cladophialophora carrionii CBS 160.54]